MIASASIDEVDSASNNQVFIEFLAQLRSYYLKRDKTPIFHSVILAGVYDIKNLKLKLRPDSEHQYNSPWNVLLRAERYFSPAVYDVFYHVSKVFINIELLDKTFKQRQGMRGGQMSLWIIRASSLSWS